MDRPEVFCESVHMSTLNPILVSVTENLFPKHRNSFSGPAFDGSSLQSLLGAERRSSHRPSADEAIRLELLAAASALAAHHRHHVCHGAAGLFRQNGKHLPVLLGVSRH